MREILFRGKRVDNGEWVHGDLKQNGATFGKRCFITRWLKPLIEVVPETVGQYTGLTDKNGTKIFEGDIVKKSWIYRYRTGRGEEEKLNSFTGVVIFEKGQFGLALDERMEFDEFVGECGHEKWTEVISNIHDNKELLEGE